MRYAFTGQWDDTTPIFSIFNDNAAPLAAGYVTHLLNRYEREAEERALDATPAPALPAVDEGRWTNDADSFARMLNEHREVLAGFRNDLTPDDYRQIAAKALQLAAEAEKGR